MNKGTIKFFNATKGFGFIIPEDQNEDEIFLHISGTKEKNLHEGDKVTYEVTQGKKGLNAINVVKTN